MMSSIGRRGNKKRNLVVLHAVGGGVWLDLRKIFRNVLVHVLLLLKRLIEFPSISLVPSSRRQYDLFSDSVLTHRAMSVRDAVKKTPPPPLCHETVRESVTDTPE